MQLAGLSRALEMRFNSGPFLSPIKRAMDHGGHAGDKHRPAREAIGWWERTLPLCRTPSRLDSERDSCEKP